MQRLLLLLLLTATLLIPQVKAQSTDAVVGKWKVVDVVVPPEQTTDQQKAAILKKQLMATVLHFKTDHHFSFNWSMMPVKDAAWQYNAQTKTYLVRDKDKSMLMELSMKQQNGKTYFILLDEEVLATLEVQSF